MFHLGLYYNYAMIAPETNFSTYCVQRLEDMGYINLYVREQVDTYTRHVQKKFGFRTTTITRPLILDALKEIVNEHTELIEDPTFFQECLSFAKNDRGKPEATSGAHDDCVMAMAIMYHCMPQASPIFNTVDEDDSSENDYSSFLNFGV
jgi:phage terminase large subunit